MSSPLPQRATIGVIGGGQLGRMLCIAAARLGFRTHVFAPEHDAIAGQVANQTTKAEYSDAVAMREFAESVDVTTFEFENIPAEVLEVLEERGAVFPPRRALAVSQDRLVEKTFLRDAGLKTAAFATVDDEQSLLAALDVVGVPAILKTRRLGYDGRGQVRILDRSQAVEAAGALDHTPCLRESVVDFRCEISVIAARSHDGKTVCFEPGENLHTDGILRTTTVPARVSDDERKAAIDIGKRIVDAFDYVGVMGVELFVTDDGILVNEIAPRVHNSGHWTLDGCVIDQFEQHIRAVAGWPLGDGSRHSNVVMTNLIGEDVSDLDVVTHAPAVALHLYGKADVRAGRKMGHFTRVTGPAESS